MGGTCVRDCERTAHEVYTSVDALPVQAGIPGLTPAPPSDQPNGDVKVGAAFANPLAAISGRSNSSAGGASVPPLYGVRALHQTDKNDMRETPRFDELTARSNVAGEFQTPRASPRESPRPPDEKQKMDPTAPAEISYEGERLGDMKHGSGCLRMNGSTYEGDFKDDQKHGQGTLTWDDGRQYRGQFEEDKFHGFAVMTWPDGRKYCGQYVEDRKHGEGTFSWQDGRRYQGQWIVGKRHGIGVYTNAKGITLSGMWEMDRPLHWDSVSRAPPVPPKLLNMQAQALETPLPQTADGDVDVLDNASSIAPAG